ncbi:rab-like protein 3 isoform X1 [Drosophila novamexicana]|uniref:rab-like protein 3 isoform X1 n=1 Tax=Drosophila novamexicana TaxID=47314 RepID=UPI0011E5EB57|nr:rab-like protein 3 isoform X1 [Drosophila novamexicana]
MAQQTIKHVSTARILLLGQAGVGKSRLTDLLARSVDTPTPSTRSVGDVWWNVQVRLHEYPCNKGMPPTPEWTSSSSPSSSHSSERFGSSCKLFRRRAEAACDMIPYFVEFYDLKSSLRMSREHRNRLFRNIDGIILVYDLLDMSSHDNLHDLLYHPLRQICRHRHKRLRPILKRRHVPILVVGTKLDMLKTRRLRRSGGIAGQLGADEILLNCLDPDSLAEKSRNEGKLRKFLNNAVDFKQYFPARRY